MKAGLAVLLSCLGVVGALAPGCWGGGEPGDVFDSGLLDRGLDGAPAGDQGDRADREIPDPDSAADLWLPDLPLAGDLADLGPTDQGRADQGLPCREDSDCPGCGICDHESGYCLPCDCLGDDECEPGQICVDHDCVPDCQETGCLEGDVCDPEIRRCVPREGCRRSSDCPEPAVCVQERCVAPVPYDSCDGVMALVAGLPIEASTRRTRDRASGSCSRGPSPDAVFGFELHEPAGVRIVVDGSGDHFDPLVYLRSSICRAGDEVLCQDTRFLYREVLALAELLEGSYFVFVESFGAEAMGEFLIELQVMQGGFCVDDALEENDSRLAPADLAMVGEQPLALCPQDPDWYAVSLFSEDDLLLSVEVEAEEDLGLIELDLLDPEGEPVALDLSQEPLRILASALGVPLTGAYALGISLAQPGPDAPLPYRLDYEVFTAHGSTDCSNPPSLRAGVEVGGNTRQGADLGSGSCCSELQHAAPEVVYKFHLEQESRVEIQVQANWQYALYLRTECWSELPEAELACRAPGRLFLPALASGTYYVFVDGYGEGSGPFSIRLDTAPPLLPPENDDCEQAEEILPGQVVEGATRFGLDDYQGSCTSPLGHSAADVVYRFSLAEARRVLIELRPLAEDGEGWAAALYLRSECANGGSEEACDNIGPRIEKNLEAGEYFIIVDGWRDDEGVFTLSLQVE